MLTTSTQLRLKEILDRISNGQLVTLKERLVLKEFADNDQKIASMLKRAKRHQQHFKPSDEIDNLLGELDLGSADADDTYSPEQDDLADWFSGAPSWLSRS